MEAPKAALTSTAVKPRHLTPELASEIRKIFDKYEWEPSRLVSILLEIQDLITKQYIPTEVSFFVSEKLDIPLSRVYDVISFYGALSAQPRAKYVISVCDSVVCQVVGNTTLISSLENILGIKMGERTADRKYMLSYTPCFGACDISPAIRINGKVIGGLSTEEKVRQALADIL